MKIKFDPTLITGLSYLFTYFRKVKLIKYFILRPLTFTLKLLNISKLSRFLKLYKIYRIVYGLFNLSNIIFAVFIFLVFSDFNVEDLLVLLALIYSRLFEFITNNILGYIYNIYILFKRKIFDLLSPNKIDSVKGKLNKTLDSEFKDNIFVSGYKYHKMHTDSEIDIPEVKSKPFYYSPYFYIPVVTVITCVTFYYYYDSIPSVVTGILAYFGFDDNNGPKPHKSSAPEVNSWVGDPSSSKAYKNAYSEVVNDPSYAPESSAPQPKMKMSASFEDNFRGLLNTHSDWARPNSPALSDSSALSVHSDTTLGKAKAD